MKKLIPLLAALLVLPVAATGQECGYIGTWLGYNSSGEVAWTSQSHGMSSSHGTVMLEVPGFDMTFGGLFDVASYTDNLKGTWERTGGHSYSVVGSGIAADADGTAIYVLRLACEASLAEDCNVLEVQTCLLTLYLPDPDTDPIPIWDREPDVGPIYFASHNGYRVTVD